MSVAVSSTLRRLAGGAAVAALLLIHPGSLPAQAAQLSAQEISQFLANPAGLLTSNPDGGGRLVSTVRDLVLSDAATLSAVTNLVAGASASQQSSMGAGLGQAAQALVRTNPALATQIQQNLAACGSACQPALVAFAAVTGNVQTAATGGGAGGGAGGGGGGVGGPITGGPPIGGSGSGGSGSSPSGGTPTQGNVFSGGIGGGVNGSGGTTGSVSPR